MMSLRLFLGFDVFMVFVSSIIALTIGYYAGKGYKLTSEKLLLYLSLSFSLLGVSLLVDGLVSIYFYLSMFKGAQVSRIVFMAGNVITSIAEVAAFTLLAYTYVRYSFITASSSFLPILMFKNYNPLVEIVLIFLLSYITIQTSISYGWKKELNSLLVFTGFLFILLAHIFFLLTSIYMFCYILAHTLQLLGFIFLLVMLLRVNKR